jgi:hypothetical protein
MTKAKSIIATLVAACVTSACAPDGVLGDDDGAGGPDGGGPTIDADVGDSPCDMTGIWIAEQHTISIALATEQHTTNWYYYSIEQDGEAFTIVDALNCGFVVDGTTTVTLDDATLAALAPQEFAGPNRGGTFREGAGGTTCEFSLDRQYNLRGANKATYLTDHWQVGDPPKALNTFPALPSAPPGMEDWDGDNMDGITLRSGLGNRYVAQRDFNEHTGTAPTFAAAFGGEGVVSVIWDSQEGISMQTPPLLRTTATPEGMGWARYARVGDRLEVVDGDPLQTCRNVQVLAQEVWPQ